MLPGRIKQSSAGRSGGKANTLILNIVILLYWSTRIVSNWAVGVFLKIASPKTAQTDPPDNSRKYLHIYIS
jgi:hypothetical protein